MAPKKSPAKRKAEDAGESEGAEEQQQQQQQQQESPAKSPAKRASKASPKKKKDAEGKEEPAAEPKQAPSAAASGKEGGEAKAPAPKRGKKTAEPEPQRPVYNESMRPPPPSAPHTKILSWNVASLRSILKKDPKAMMKLIERENADIVCIQETKISEKQVPEVTKQMVLPPGWHTNWACSTDKAGYSGVGTLSKAAPLTTSTGLGIAEHDGEGRILMTEWDQFYCVNVYVPNAGEGLARLNYRVGKEGWDAALSEYVKNLQKTKPVVLVGDMNCAHQEIDIKNPKTNLKSAGFTPEERESFGSRYLTPLAQGGCELTDTYRKQFPDVVGYTYFSYRFNCRAKGIGWRLDYFLASKELAPKVYDTFMLPDVLGSDHVPLGATILKS